jgi:hypothetical protein
MRLVFYDPVVLSTFSGTHFLQPRPLVARFGFTFQSGLYISVRIASQADGGRAVDDPMRTLARELLRIDWLRSLSVHDGINLNRERKP